MGRVSKVTIKVTADQRASSSSNESDSNRADARRQLAASNKKMEIKCHRKAIHSRGRCVARAEKAIKFGYLVCRLLLEKKKELDGNRLGFRIFRKPGR